MKIERFEAGPLDTNGYIVSENGNCLIVDPSLNCDNIIEAVKKADLKPLAILLTHSHFDHYLGMYEVREEFGELPIWLHDDEKEIISNSEKNLATYVGLTDVFTGETIMYNEGENTIGEFTFTTFFTPGHTPGGTCLLFGNDLLTGDTLFNGSVGRSDFEYSDPSALTRSIEEKLFTLPPETVVWPGHGWSSTIGAEKENNPYFK